MTTQGTINLFFLSFLFFILAFLFLGGRAFRRRTYSAFNQGMSAGWTASFGFVRQGSPSKRLTGSRERGNKTCGPKEKERKTNVSNRPTCPPSPWPRLTHKKEEESGFLVPEQRAVRSFRRTCQRLYSHQHARRLRAGCFGPTLTYKWNRIHIAPARPFINFITTTAFN